MHKKNSTSFHFIIVALYEIHKICNNLNYIKRREEWKWNLLMNLLLRDFMIAAYVLLFKQNLKKGMCVSYYLTLCALLVIFYDLLIVSSFFFSLLSRKLKLWGRLKRKRKGKICEESYVDIRKKWWWMVIILRFSRLFLHLHVSFVL